MASRSCVRQYVRINRSLLYLLHLQSDIKLNCQHIVQCPFLVVEILDLR